VRLLLDTHIWLWSLLDPGRLTKRVFRALEREDTELWLSPISVWELLTLVDKGRVRLGSPPTEWVTTALQRVPFHEATVTHEVALETRNVRLSHRDPARPSPIADRTSTARRTGRCVPAIQLPRA